MPKSNDVGYPARALLETKEERSSQDMPCNKSAVNVDRILLLTDFVMRETVQTQGHA